MALRPVGEDWPWSQRGGCKCDGLSVEPRPLLVQSEEPAPASGDLPATASSLPQLLQEPHLCVLSTYSVPAVWAHVRGRQWTVRGQAVTE